MGYYHPLNGHKQDPKKPYFRKHETETLYVWSRVAQEAQAQVKGAQKGSDRSLMTPWGQVTVLDGDARIERTQIAESKGRT